MELFSGFVLGLLGSFHCVGMCGPIALAIPSGTQSRRKFIYGRLLYNSGRIISYSAIELIFGLLGSRIYLFGLQQSLFDYNCVNTNLKRNEPEHSVHKAGHPSDKRDFAQADVQV